MRSIKYWTISLIVFIGLTACADNVTEMQQAGNPTMQIENQFSNVHFGDILPFVVTVNDDKPLSILTVKLYFGEEEMSKTTIRTKENGQYSGTINIPFLKDIPDGTATLEFELRNTTMKTAKTSFDVSVTRAKYPYLILVTEQGSYAMTPTSTPNEYAITEPFPSTDLPAIIKTPTVDQKGSEITFGWDAGAITQGVTESIPFSSSTGGAYTVSFNTKTYQATPFFEILINDEKLKMIDKENYEADINLTQGAELKVEGLDNLANWWIDTDYLTQKTPGVYTFVPISGKYRINANLKLKYFRIEALDGNSPATLKEDGTGAIWIIGQYIGKPSITTKEVGWNTSNALCMAPIGNKKHQITVVGGETINTDEINFNFFHQKGWGGSFISTNMTTTSDIIFIGDGKNGRDNGNLGILPNLKLETGATYIFTVDVAAGIDKAVLTVKKK